MWTFPTTSVNQCWDALTFGMSPWHVGRNDDLNQSKAKDALQSQSPIAAFKATNMLQALGIAYSKIVLPSADSKGAEKDPDLLPHDMDTLQSMGVCIHVCGSIETGRCESIVVQRDDTSSSHSIEQQEPVSSKLRICRLCQHDYHLERKSYRINSKINSVM